MSSKLLLDVCKNIRVVALTRIRPLCCCCNSLSSRSARRHIDRSPASGSQRSLRSCIPTSATCSGNQGFSTSDSHLEGRLNSTPLFKAARNGLAQPYRKLTYHKGSFLRRRNGGNWGTFPVMAFF
jgi:hypothetical protein